MYRYVKHIIDPVLDERLARFVVGSHVRSHPRFDATGNDDAGVSGAPNFQGAAGGFGGGGGGGAGLHGANANGEAGSEIEPIPQDMLRKYISYAKRYIKPKLSSGDLPKIAQVYAELRRESVTREVGLYASNPV